MQRRIGRRRLTVAAGAVVTAATAVLVIASSALARWTPTVTLTASRYEGQAPPAVAEDRYGDTLLAWAAMSEDPVNGYTCYHQVELRMRSRTGTLGPIETLTPSCVEHDWPVAAIDDGGAGIVAWINNKTGAVEARRTSVTGTLGPLLTLTPQGDTAGTVAIAESPAGQALATWVGQQGTNSPAVQARYIGLNNVAGPVLNLGGAPYETPSVVIGRNGVATIAWATGGNQQAVARRLTGSTVGPQTVIQGPAANTRYGVMTIADDGYGNTSLLVQHSVLAGNRQTTYLDERQWTRAGALGPVRQLAVNPDMVAMATDGAGDTLAAWNQYVTATQSAIFARRVSRTGVLGATVKLGLGYVPAITVDPAGAGLVAWQSTEINSTTSAVTQQYARPVNVATNTYTSQFTLTSDGNLVRLGESWDGKYAAIWQQSTPAWPIRARFGP